MMNRRGGSAASAAYTRWTGLEISALIPTVSISSSSAPAQAISSMVWLASTGKYRHSQPVSLSAVISRRSRRAVAGAEADHRQRAGRSASRCCRASAAISFQVSARPPYSSASLGQRRPFRGRAREPEEELLRQIASFDRLGELLRDIRFGENHFHFHKETNHYGRWRQNPMICMPASTNRILPVTPRPRSLARKTAVSATSAGSVLRRRGARFWIVSRMRGEILDRRAPTPS